MFKKSARFALAAILALSLSPMSAFAADEEVPAADGGYATTTQADELPQISSVKVDSRNVVIAGSSFGEAVETSTARALVGGVASGEEIASTVGSWSDTEIVLVLEADPAGIIEVEVTTELGTARMSAFVSASSAVYEETLPQDSFAEDYANAFPASGILKGWGEHLYYLREVPVSSDGTTFAYSSFSRYDIKKNAWEPLESLPELLVYASACIWEGNFLVTGVAYDESAGGVTGEQRIYLYNIARSTWAPLDATGVPLGAGIVSLNGFLKLVGGADSSWNFSNGVYEYDTGSGIGEYAGTLATPAFCPQLAVNDGRIYVYSYGDTLAQYDGDNATRHLQVLDGESATELSGVFPEFVQADTPIGTAPRAEQFGSLAAAIEGLVLVGPASYDSASNAYTDTYLLDWDSPSAKFEFYPRRASDARVFGAAACIHNNRLYAAAASEVEPGNAVFRATEVLTPAVLSGNNSVWRRDSGETLTMTFSPDLSRFADRLYVDGVELSNVVDYSASTGSTIIDIAPSYLSSLKNGKHTVRVFFDGYEYYEGYETVNESSPGAEVVAYFTIEGQAKKVSTSRENKAKSGKKASSLASTGDQLLVVPFVILGVGAAALGVYLVRRKMRGN